MGDRVLLTAISHPHIALTLYKNKGYLMQDGFLRPPCHPSRMYKKYHGARLLGRGQNSLRLPAYGRNVSTCLLPQTSEVSLFGLREAALEVKAIASGHSQRGLHSSYCAGLLWTPQRCFLHSRSGRCLGKGHRARCFSKASTPSPPAVRQFCSHVMWGRCVLRFW